MIRIVLKYSDHIWRCKIRQWSIPTYMIINLTCNMQVIRRFFRVKGSYLKFGNNQEQKDDWALACMGSIIHRYWPFFSYFGHGKPSNHQNLYLVGRPLCSKAKNIQIIHLLIRTASDFLCRIAGALSLRTRIRAWEEIIPTTYHISR